MIKHRVREGEHLSRIAHGYGHRKIAPLWNHPDNASLKSERLNPHVLNPGDVVAVPEVESKEMNAPTDQVHRFQVAGERLKLGLKLIGPAGTLQRGILREVYSFDGFHGQGSDAATTAFCNALVSFVRGDPAKRAFRAYSKNGTYRDILSTALPGAAATRGPAGSVEFEHDAFTILFVPTPFWSFLPIVVPGKSLDDHAHQTIPAYFMQHARLMSRLV